MNKKTGASRQASSGVSMVKPYLAGLFSGLFIAFLVNLLDINPQQLIKRDKATSSTDSKAESAAKTKSATKFDFYTVLPEQEVVIAEDVAPAATNPDGTAVVAPVGGAVVGTTVPPPAIDANKNAPIINLSQPAPNAAAIAKITSEKTASEKPKASIYLQAGSFRRNEEADRRRAQLLMFGFRANVDTINSNNENWYRVQIGPFASDAEMSAARAKLKTNGIETLMTRRK
jgi:cell division protein FtsN